MNPLDHSQPVLIVEDSDDDFEATERALKRSGNLANPIYRCESGQDAIDYLQREAAYADPSTSPRPGIILLDLNMPGLDGRAVLDLVKSSPELCDIPVIILTTSDDSVDMQECYRKGANTYIKKPVELGAFVDAVRSLKEYWFGVAILPREDQDVQTA